MSHTLSPSPAGSRHLTAQRLLLWAVLLVFAFFFLLPLYVMVSTSLKSMDEVRSGTLLSVPLSPSLDAWSKAWHSACTGTDCGGLKPFFMNSVLMVVPAVLISTALGAINGYVLTKWRFRGSELLFGLLLFGVFMPMQVVLLPMSQVLGALGIASSVWGLILVHILAGMPSTTLFFRNYYAGLPDELIKAATLGDATRNGSFFAPRAYELASLSQLKREVFGPVLHVIRYEARDLDKVLAEINATGYGLTLGIHSRIDATVQHIVRNVRVGNCYVNRNQIGAVVGVQPFGGEGLSGTGPKAGGPHYLLKFASERTLTINTTAAGGNASLLTLAE